MKKIINYVLLAGFLFSMTACGRQMAKDAADPTPDTGLVSEGGAAGAVGEEPGHNGCGKIIGFYCR